MKKWTVRIKDRGWKRYFCCWIDQLPVITPSRDDAMEFASQEMAEYTAKLLDDLRKIAFPNLSLVDIFEVVEEECCE